MSAIQVEPHALALTELAARRDRRRLVVLTARSFAEPNRVARCSEHHSRVRDFLPCDRQ